MICQKPKSRSNDSKQINKSKYDTLLRKTVLENCDKLQEAIKAVKEVYLWCEWEIN